MTRIQVNKYSLLAGTFLLGLNSLAFATDEITPISIPMVDNAQVFAQFTDDVPAVLNYFTSFTEAEVISFYDNIYGEFTTQERKRERLILTYANNDKAIRVIVSQQNNKRQVDIIMDKVPR